MPKDINDIQFKPLRRPDMPEWLQKFAISFYYALKKQPEKHQSPVDPIKLSKDYGDSALPVRQFKSEEKQPSYKAKSTAMNEQLNMDLPPTTKVVTRVNPQVRDAVDVDKDRRDMQSSEGRISSRQNSLEKVAKEELKIGDIVVYSSPTVSESKYPRGLKDPWKIIGVDTVGTPPVRVFHLQFLHEPEWYRSFVSDDLLIKYQDGASNLMEE